jgi:hypothetical protein
MSTPRDCSGGPIGQGTRRIAQRGLIRQTEGSGFLFQRPNPTRQDCCLVQLKEFNRNIESFAKWIEGAIQGFRSGVKNARVAEVHNTCHYIFIVDEALVVRETRKFLLDE